MTTIIKDTGVGFSNTVSPYISSTTPSSYKNRIINGNMCVDQRYGGATLAADTTLNLKPSVSKLVSSPNGTLYYYGTYLAVDRWLTFVATKDSLISANSYQINTGYTNYTTEMLFSGHRRALKVERNTSTLTPTEAYIGVAQRIESYNIADLSNKTVTLSGFLSSSQLPSGCNTIEVIVSGTTNTYADTWTVYNNSNFMDYATQIYNSSVTLSSVNDVTYFKMTFNLGASAVKGLQVLFRLQVGSNVNGTTGDNFIITGVQLEEGDDASNFEYLSYDQHLKMCQYYTYCALSSDLYSNNILPGKVIFPNMPIYYFKYMPPWKDGNSPIWDIIFPTTMRTVPNVTDYYGVRIVNYNVNVLSKFTFGGASLNILFDNQTGTGSGGNYITYNDISFPFTKITTCSKKFSGVLGDSFTTNIWSGNLSYNKVSSSIGIGSGGRFFWCLCIDNEIY